MRIVFWMEIILLTVITALSVMQGAANLIAKLF